MNLIKNQNNMNIVGQGGKIILFILPALIAAILLHIFLPGIAVVPISSDFSALIMTIIFIGYVLLALGLIVWGMAVFQLLKGFPKGKLVTTSAYGIVRNPIYSSVTFFILPAVSFLTLTWVYLVVSLFLYVGVLIFIGPEEEKLKKVFGKQYENYLKNVDRMIPFRKPGK